MRKSRLDLAQLPVVTVLGAESSLSAEPTLQLLHYTDQTDTREQIIKESPGMCGGNRNGPQRLFSSPHLLSAHPLHQLGADQFGELLRAPLCPQTFGLLAVLVCHGRNSDPNSIEPLLSSHHQLTDLQCHSVPVLQTRCHVPSPTCGRSSESHTWLPLVWPGETRTGSKNRKIRCHWYTGKGVDCCGEQWLVSLGIHS